MRLRAFAYLAVSALVLTALVAIGALLFASFDKTTMRILSTSASVALFTLLAMGGAAAFTPAAGRFARAVGTTAVVSSIVSFLLIVVAIWGTVEHATLHEKVMGSAITVAVATSVVALLGRLTLDSSREWMRCGTTACVFLFATGLIVLWTILEGGHPRWERANAACGVLASLGIVLVPLFAWFERRAARNPASKVGSTVCPACGHAFVPAVDSAP